MTDSSLHPFFETREEKKVAVVLMTSDAGLCGSYNTDLIQFARRFFAEHPKQMTVISVGKFGISALKRMGFAPHSTFQDIRVSRVEEVLTELTSALEKLYLAKEADAIYVIYSHFMTLSTYKGIITKLLPFKAPAELAEKGKEIQTSDYIYEPRPELIFKKLVPLYFESKIRMMFLESFVSEQIARMTAMRQATDNAKEMIESLTLQRNKARQASITKELIEIVSGSKAQKNK